MRRRKSQFVNVLGWTLIITSGIGLIKTSFKNVIFNFLFPSDFFEHHVFQINSFSDLPVVSYFRVFTFSASLLFATTFIFAIFFLKYKEWARKGIVILFGVYLFLIATANIVMWTTGDFFLGITSFPVNNGLIFSIILLTFKIFATAFSIAICVLILWLIKKCNSEFIKKKFL